MKREQLILSIGTLLLGLLLGYFFFSETGGAEKESTEEKEGTEKATTYTCSMHPQIRKKEPGKCPICGMELIPADNMASKSETVIEMSENAVELADIQTSPVRRISPEKSLRLQGEVRVDERRRSLITARFPGRIEKLYVDFTGQKVHKGQRLAAIYSPKLIQAQRELFEAKKSKEEDPKLYRAARNKLKLWDLTEEQIQAIEDSGKPQERVDIRAPHSGIVTQRKVTLGQYLKEGDPLFKLADLSKVWIMFDAYEQDLPWLDEGDNIRFSVAGIPDRTFESRVRFIHPTLEKNTRTVSVRAEARNPNGELRPGMFATGRIQGELDIQGPRTVVPRSAVLWTGTRSVVWVEVPNTEEPTYEFREVELGTDLGASHIVKSGLDTNERVVTNGTFSVDAAAQLAGKKSMMMQMDQQKGKSKSKEHEHEMSGGPSGKELQGSIDKYLKLKNALVASKAQKASEYGKELLDAFKKLKEGLSEKDRKAWASVGQTLKKEAKRIAEGEKLEGQRKAFSKLSQAMLEAVRRWGTGGKTLYKDHCPMAMDGEGADWLSEFEKIKNPYYGEKMMNCGKVKDTFGE